MASKPQHQDEKVSVPFLDEPGSVYMLPAEWELFKKKLGENCAYYWCEQAELYSESYPRKWAKYKDHFRTLLNWHRMRVADGYEWFDHPTAGPGYYRTFVIDRILRGQL